MAIINSSGTILFEDNGDSPNATGKFVNPYVDWSAALNTSTNKVTITAVFKAYTTGTLRNFSDRFVGTIVIGGDTKDLGPYAVSIATGGSTVVTTIDSHVKELNLGENGSGSFTVTITGGNPGTSWASTGLLAGQNNVLSFDYVRLPSTPAAPTLARSNNGATVTITGATASFFGTNRSYQYRVSRNNGTSWYTSGTLNSSRKVVLTVPNTNDLIAQTRAVDSEGTGSYSASSSTSNGVPDTPSAAPTLTRTADGTSITLTSAIVTDAVSYDYRQSTDGSTWGNKVDIASGRAVTITGLVYDQTYFYQTRATNTTGDGAWSATSSIVGASPSFSGTGTDTTVASPAIWGVSYTDGVTALRAREYSVVPNTLPAGLSLNTATGAITGTPTSTTTFSSTFTITATNNAGTATTSATIAVISPVRVNISGPNSSTASFRTGAVNVNTATGTTPSFKTGIVRVWKSQAEGFVPSRLAQKGRKCVVVEKELT